VILGKKMLIGEQQQQPQQQHRLKIVGQSYASSAPAALKKDNDNVHVSASEYDPYAKYE